jgi:hypothetical protein
VTDERRCIKDDDDYEQLVEHMTMMMIIGFLESETGAA